MNKLVYRVAAALCMGAMLDAPILLAYSAVVETFENKTVAKITLIMESENCPFDPQSLKSRMSTKQGDPFHQLTFDTDLKMLAEEYDRIEPSLEVINGQVYITVRLWQKPIIKRIEWQGNKKLKTSTLTKELGVSPGEVFDRDTFNKGFMKIKELYVKKGYFEVQGSYRIVPQENSNDIVIEINIREGRSGRIAKMEFEGFTSGEEKEIMRKMVSKKYNFLISWVTGSGIYRDDMMEHDKLIIVNYLQNKGYADAKVSITQKEDPIDPAKLIIVITADRGDEFHFGEITFCGNKLYTDSQIQDIFTIHDGDPYSPDALRDTVQNIKDLYGQRGYIDTSVSYQLYLMPDEPVYNVQFDIDEGEQYRVGLVRVLGNVSTETRVILHQTNLVPGEVFDSNKLKATEYRLLGTGYFKTVNVYPVKSQYDSDLGPNFRDVIIEVEETTTGNVSLFFGASSVDDIFGGLDISENNFNHKGLTRFWKDGFSALRGGGELASAKVQIGKKTRSYTINWMEPHFKDTNWRVGFDVNYTHSTVISDNFDIDTGGGTIFASYPLSGYWTATLKWRIRNSVIDISTDPPKIPKAKTNAAGQITNEKEIKQAMQNQTAWKKAQTQQERNSGLVMGVGGTFGFDSTDRPYKPRMGARSFIEGEICGVRRHSSDDRCFPFMKAAYLNTYYHPIGKRGIFKARGDVRVLDTFGLGKPELLPFPERYVMGGENSVRGYEQFSIGPLFPGEQNNTNDNDIDPLGGATSMLLSVEYLHEIIPPFLDVFVFIDGGSADIKPWHFNTLRTSAGAGVRIDIGNRVPFIFGYGYPLNPRNRKVQEKSFFFSMGGQF
ncbi:MAG: outer membrane protein assembly factor BamA [Chlamydiales bacterium]|nr:outer membrane protein assembly factor BamA [Chlamydiales bacterium]